MLRAKPAVHAPNLSRRMWGGLFLALFTLGIFGSGLERSACAALPAQGTSEEIEWGPTVEGVQLSARLERAEVPLGEPIRLLVALKNSGSGSISVSELGLEQELELVITDPNGRMVAESGERKADRERKQKSGFGSGHMGGLGPNQVLSLELLVNPWWNIKDLGLHRIVVKRRVFVPSRPDSIVVESNRVELMIIPPEGKT